MPTQSKMSAPLALTMGEPGGVGPELTAKVWADHRHEQTPFFVIADASAFPGVPLHQIAQPKEAMDVFASGLPIIHTNHPVSAAPGKASSENAPAILESIERAVAYACNGEAAAVVTNPIQKSSLIDAGFTFPGHTEFLAALTQKKPMPAKRTRGAVMMIAGPQLRTVPITIHHSVKDAIASLTTADIVEAGIVTAQALRSEFGILEPRLAISGLNPHAGEDGAMGSEDKEIILPAVAQLKEAGIIVSGPLPADTMFHAEARATYDAALCMLHDQALIPAKTLGFHDAVNVTLGLPIIRTSPDHGTALDIAGNGTARPDSLLAAIDLAASLSSRRQSIAHV